MTKLLKITSLTALLLFSLQALASDLETYTAKLHSYQEQDLILSDSNNEKAVAFRTQEILQTVQDASDYLITEKEKINQDIANELVRVAVLSFKTDPSEAATEMLAPLYKKHTALFERAIKSLPKKSAREITDSIQNVLREETEGNG